MHKMTHIPSTDTARRKRFSDPVVARAVAASQAGGAARSMTRCPPAFVDRKRLH
jgi:hypothetical protein